MAETGWPLIPREVLPAPVEAVRRPKRAPAPVDGIRQLSIFGAETTEPSPADLAGLLAGPGRLGRMGGTARVSVTVGAAWRVHVLVAELVSRGLVVSWLPVEKPVEEPVEEPVDNPVENPGEHEEQEIKEEGADVRELGSADGRGEPEESSGAPAVEGSDTVPDRPGLAVATFEVRTAYSSRLSALARAWPPPPDRLFLSGPRLRLWVAAAGEPRPGGYALGLDPVDDPEIADSALVRAGLAGTVSDQGLHYLIAGRKRLRRLAELVGERPPAAPEELWPGGAAA